MSTAPKRHTEKWSEAPKTLSDTEASAFLYELNPYQPGKCRHLSNLRNATMALFMLDAGLRVSEVCGLLITDVVISGHLVEALYVRAEIAKRGRSRTVPLSPRLKQYLLPYTSMFSAITGNVTDRLLFYSPKGRGKISPRQVQRITESAGQKAIGRKVNPHMLRHTFGTKLMRSCNARIVQELLGHKNLTSTQIYMSPDMNDLSKAINKMNGGT